MRVMILAAFATVLLACQQPSITEADENLDQAVPSSDTVPSRLIVEEPEEHQGC